MAQQDTGLGWSAKSEWLISSSGVIGEISEITGTGFTNQPLPYLGDDPSPADVKMSGFYYGTANMGWSVYLVSLLDDDLFLARIGNQTHVYKYTGQGDATSTAAYIYDQSGNHRSTARSSGRFTTSINGFYYSQYGEPGYTYADRAIPSFTSDAVAISNLQVVNETFTKINQGPAVAALARWYTTEGTELISPVLISSIADYTFISVNGVTPAPTQTTVDFLYDGMRFYMSLVGGNSEEISSLLEQADLRQFGAAAPSKVFALIADASFSNILVTESVDPYEDFGNTEEDAGEVDPDPDDDDIEEDSLPTTSFADAGFCRIYSPSLAQLDSLSNYLWTDQTFLQTVINHLKQIIENPIDAIISLSLIPCVPPTSTNEEVKVMFIPTGVYMPPVTNQFVEVDCGTFALKEMYGSALDYNPYTSVQLYLPYVGIVQLDTDEVMGKVIHVGYRIDVVTGVCCAYVKAGNDVLYQFSGHCSIQQPITSADFSGYINAALAAGKLVASVAAAGAGAPEVAASLVGAPSPSVSSTSSDTRITERNESTGRQITAGTKHQESKTEKSGASFGEVAARGISNTVGAVMNSKTIVQHSGGFSGNSGYLAAVRRPYLIVTRPRIANPEKYGEFNGRPSMIYLNLGSCTGYTQVQSVHLTGIDATNPELSEIATLLTSGVIF